MPNIDVTSSDVFYFHPRTATQVRLEGGKKLEVRAYLLYSEPDSQQVTSVNSQPLGCR